MGANTMNQTDTIVEKLFAFFENDQPSNTEGNEIIEILSQQISVNPESAEDILNELAEKYNQRIEELYHRFK